MPEPVKRGPGRPRKDAAKNVMPSVPSLSPPPAAPKHSPRHAKPETPPVSKPTGYMGPQPDQICRECYPDGWPNGWSGVGCPHGIWTRRV